MRNNPIKHNGRRMTPIIRRKNSLVPDTPSSPRIPSLIRSTHSAIDQKEKHGQQKKPTYKLQQTVFRLFMFFSFLITALTTAYTVFSLLIVKQAEWVSLAFDEAVLLNLDIMAQAGAPENKDFFAQSITDLQISKAFIEKFMDEQQQNEQFLNSRYWNVTLMHTEIDDGFEPELAGCIYEDGPIDENETSVDSATSGGRRTLQGEEATDPNQEAGTNQQTENDVQNGTVSTTGDEESVSSDSSEPAAEEEETDPATDEETATEGGDGQSTDDMVDPEDTVTVEIPQQVKIEETCMGQQVFYSSIDFPTEDQRQKEDAKLCQLAAYLFQNLLNYESHLPRKATFIGFTSDSLCTSPAKYEEHFNNENTATYSVLDQEWFITQQENQEYGSTLGNIEKCKHDTGMACAIHCVPLDKDGEFYASLCFEFIISQTYSYTSSAQHWNQQSDDFEPILFQQPQVMQSNFNPEESIIFKSEITATFGDFANEVSNLIFADTLTASMYRNSNIKTGTFLLDINNFSSCGNQVEYTWQQLFVLQLLGDGDLDKRILECNIDQTDSVFFIHKNLNFANVYVHTPYHYFIFYPQIGIWSQLVVLKLMLFMHIFSFWIPYFIWAHFCYIVICIANIILIGGKMTAPIIELTNRLNINIINVRKLKKRQQKKGEDKNRYMGLQIDLLKGYVEQNKETNDLYKSFNQMAKVLFVAHTAVQNEFSYQALYNLHQAIYVFNNMKNNRGRGTCYMILGTMVATQSMENYHKGIKYIDEAMICSQIVIEQQNRECQGADMTNKFLEDKLILAFRQYTRGIISYNYFVTLDEKSRYHYQDDENQRIEYIRQFEDKANDAMTFLMKCLDTLPDCSQHPDRNRGNRETLKSVAREYESSSDDDISHMFSMNNLKRHDSDSSLNDRREFEDHLDASLLDKDQYEEAKMKRTIVQVQNPDSSNSAIKDSFMMDSFNPMKIMVQNLQVSTVSDQQPQSQEQDVAPDSRENDCDDTPQETTNLRIPHNIHVAAMEDSQRFITNMGPGSANVTDKTISELLTPNPDKRQTDIDVKEDFQEFVVPDRGQERLMSDMRKRANSQDQFQDFRIFIKLLMTELKILLLPTLDVNLVQASSRRESNRFARDSMPYSHRFSDSNGDVFEDKKRHSNQSLSNDSYLEMAVNESYNPFEDHNQAIDRKEKIKEFFFGADASMYIGEELTKELIQKQLVTDLAELRDEIKHFELSEMPEGKRYGLSYTEKSYLIQFQRYLEGLYCMVAQKNEDIAITRFKNSLQKTDVITNDLAKKTLLRMQEIFMQRTARVTDQMDEKAKKKRLLQRQQTNIQQIKRRATVLEDQLFWSHTAEQDLNLSDHEITMKKRGSIMLSVIKENPEGQPSDGQEEKKVEDPVKTQQKHQMDLQILDSQVQWVTLQLSHHILSKRSIYFVLDCYFEQYKWFERCRNFIIDTFNELHNEDYFGLLSLQDGSLYNIDLEVVGANRSMKRTVLSEFADADILDGPKVKRRNRVAVWMEEVIQASRAVPTTTKHYRGTEFEDPAKWVVVFLGSYRDLFNLEGLDIGSDPKTNILIVCMTSESIDSENVDIIKSLISMTNEGGIYIMRYNEADVEDEQHFDSKIEQTIKTVKSAIDLYPSKNVPIIQEELDF